MLAHIHDTPLKNPPVKALKEWCDGDFFIVNMEQLSKAQHGGSKHDNYVWRVWYEYNDPANPQYKGVHMRHYADRDRAKLYFDEAVIFSGWLHIDHEVYA